MFFSRALAEDLPGAGNEASPSSGAAGSEANEVSGSAIIYTTTANVVGELPRAETLWFPLELTPFDYGRRAIELMRRPLVPIIQKAREELRVARNRDASAGPHGGWDVYSLFKTLTFKGPTGVEKDAGMPKSGGTYHAKHVLGLLASSTEHGSDNNWLNRGTEIILAASTHLSQERNSIAHDDGSTTWSEPRIHDIFKAAQAILTVYATHSAGAKASMHSI